MNTEIIGVVIMFVVMVLLAIPLGKYIGKVFEGERTWLDPVLNPLDKFFYKIGGINPGKQMTWIEHLVAMLLINFVWFILAMLILMNQGWLPLNPDGNPSMTADLAFNTAASFISNTNIQHYSGETVSYLGQLTLQFFQFVSAGTGIAVCIIVFVAMKERTTDKLGNFYVYLIKACTRVLLPLSIIGAIFLLFNGTPMTFHGKDQFISLQGDTVNVSRGPAAAMIAIKQIGTNGGGFFGVNSAHPFENPSYATASLEVIYIILIPIALLFTLGYMLKRKRLAWTFFIIMAIGFLLFVIPSIYFEMKGNPAITKMGISQPMGSMEGKEVRFGSALSAYWGISTTVTSNGSVCAMHDSFTPLTGMFCMWGMMVNCIFGGVGVGFLNFYIFIIIAVFIGGLMVGRTPEFLGKKLEAKETKIATIIALLHIFLALGATALACHLYNSDPKTNAAWLNNPGYHGFSEMLYEYFSASANNGSEFAGLSANVPFWNISDGIIMIIGRYLPIIGPLAIAGIMAKKKYVPESAGTLKTDTSTFGILVLAVIFIIAALSFFPALVLGPIAEFFWNEINNQLHMPHKVYYNKVKKQKTMSKHTRTGNTLFEASLVKDALKHSFIKMNPRIMFRNPVMFTVEVGTAIMLIVCIWILKGENTQGSFAYNFCIFIILFITLLFANFAEAIAEARGKAQADSLRKTREETPAKKVFTIGDMYVNEIKIVPSSQLAKGDFFICEAGDMIPMDGEIVEGLATIDESAITGESAPVIREAGGDKSSVTGGTKVLSDKIKVKVTTAPGESFLDKMIALVEGASRQKTPNEIALTILLAGFTIIFIIVCVTLKPFGDYASTPITIAAFISLFVCLIPTTIGGLLSAIGIAGMDRALRANVITKSGKAVETAGDLDTLLLDKTGTITIGNRKATNFYPANNIDSEIFVEACVLASLADQTPEGKSIVELGSEKGIKAPVLQNDKVKFIEFTAETRSSGIDMGDLRIRKGAFDTIKKMALAAGNSVPIETEAYVKRIASNGGTPLVVCQNEKILGVIELQDIIKPGIQERFQRLRKMGVKTVMVTGDNPLTAKFIAEKAGVDDFIAEAKPEDKMNYIKKEQFGGKLVAMMGDGTNDAPALAQADVGVAMNSGTQAAKEAGNMVDLDNDPTKLIEIVEIGKQLLMTRGTLTTFSIANDVAKYFAIVPALFIVSIPALQGLNIMHLHSPESAILSAVIFNAIIIPLLIPLALRGVAYKPIGASALLRRNMFIYGLGGIIVPFIGIKLIDLLVSIWF